MARRALIAEIEADVRETADMLGRAGLDPRVIEALLTVPRDAFVPVDEIPWAYQNRPLPIGFGQTISQPYIVAIMTDLLDLEEGQRVLEVGTGSGYQAAILAQLGAQVWTIEVVPELAREAAERLARLGLGSVQVRLGDGNEGWPEAAPFDRIIVTAAAPGGIPPALAAQLAPGGRMILPVDREGGGASHRLFAAPQELILIEKDRDGGIRSRNVLPVAFVPLVSPRPIR